MNQHNATYLFFRCFIFGILLLFSLHISAQNNVGFEISSPEAEGISSSAILSFIDKAEEKVDAVHSYMILRHGKLISQGWWAPYEPEIPHVMHSLSKSFTSTAIGILVGEGKLSLNDKVLSFFPEYAPEKPSWQLDAMRIRDLLTMNTGHIDEPAMWNMEKDWVKYFIEQKVDLKPGTHFKYNSPATYMLSAILQKITGEKLVDYLEPRLFQPLQIKKPAWDLSPEGINTGGWGLHIITEDIAKLGQLYLQKGMWKGKQILTEEWVAMATSKQVSNGSNPDNDWEQGYGFQFWQCRHNCYRGDGAMGQFCIVIPEHDAVVAITSGTSDMGAVMNVVWETLLPAFQEKALPSDPLKLNELKQKASQLSLKPIAGELSSPISKKLAKKTFELKENALGVKTISFDLHKEKHHIRIESEGGMEKIEIGAGTYLSGTMKGHLPYAHMMLKSIASSGAWISPDTYQLRIYFTETPAKITYTFRFNEEGLEWDSKLEQSLFGSQKQATLFGR